jgi:hypothetical protein
VVETAKKVAASHEVHMAVSLATGSLEQRFSSTAAHLRPA